MLLNLVAKSDLMFIVSCSWRNHIKLLLMFAAEKLLLLLLISLTVHVTGVHCLLEGQCFVTFGMIIFIATSRHWRRWTDVRGLQKVLTGQIYQSHHPDEILGLAVTREPALRSADDSCATNRTRETIEIHQGETLYVPDFKHQQQQPRQAFVLSTQYPWAEQFKFGHSNCSLCRLFEMLAFKRNTLRPRQIGRHFCDDIFKYIFLNEMYKLRLIFHWNLLPRVQLTIFQDWFREWLGQADQATRLAMIVRLLTYICDIWRQRVMSLRAYTPPSSLWWTSWDLATYSSASDSDYLW